MDNNKNSMDMYIFDTTFIIERLNRLIKQSEQFKTTTKIGMTCIEITDEYKKWLDDCQDCVYPIINDDEIANEIYQESQLVLKQSIQTFEKFVKKLEDLADTLPQKKIVRYKPIK